MIVFRCLALIALFLPLICLPAPAQPQSFAAQFEQANKLYEQGKFEEAGAAYEMLAASGVRAASVWFNLGNAAYKSGRLGRAIAAYRTAAWLTPRDSALRANLQFVRGKVYSDERTRVPLWKQAVRLATLNEWTVLTAASLWAFFFVLACGQWTGRPYTKTATLFLAMAVLCGTGTAAVWQEQKRADAVVIAKEATVRFGPLNESQAAFQLRDGAELTVLASKDDWLQIRDAEKRIGWIRRDEVIVLGIPRPHLVRAARGRVLPYQLQPAPKPFGLVPIPPTNLLALVRLCLFGPHFRNRHHRRS